MMKVIRVVGAAIVRGDRCLAAQRGPQMRHALEWEFPGGKIEPGESPEAALRRELAEELGIEIEVGAWLGRGEVVSEGRRVVLDVYLARWVSGELALAEHAEVRWVDGEGVEGLAWAEADVPVLAALRAVLSEA